MTNSAFLNLGLGLIAEMALNNENDKELVARDISHLFPISTTFIGIRQDTFVRAFAFDFIKMFVDEDLVQKDKCDVLPGSGVDIEKFKPVEKEDDGSQYIEKKVNRG